MRHARPRPPHHRATTLILLGALAAGGTPIGVAGPFQRAGAPGRSAPAGLASKVAAREAQAMQPAPPRLSASQVFVSGRSRGFAPLYGNRAPELPSPRLLGESPALQSAPDQPLTGSMDTPHNVTVVENSQEAGAGPLATTMLGLAVSPIFFYIPLDVRNPAPPVETIVSPGRPEATRLPATASLENAHGMLLIGDVAFRKGLLARAQAAYEQAYSLDSSSAVCALAVAEVLFARRRFQPAAEVVVAALSRPEQLRRTVDRIALYPDLERLLGAIEQFKEYLRTHPEQPEALVLRAYILITELGDRPATRKAVRIAHERYGETASVQALEQRLAELAGTSKAPRR